MRVDKGNIIHMDPTESLYSPMATEAQLSPAENMMYQKLVNLVKERKVEWLRLGVGRFYAEKSGRLFEINIADNPLITVYEMLKSGMPVFCFYCRVSRGSHVDNDLYVLASEQWTEDCNERTDVFLGS